MKRRKRDASVDWRAVLTDAERQTIDAADRAKKKWSELNAARAGIVNRAIQRAKYRNGPPEKSE